MSSKSESLALLPNGFSDLLPPVAEREAAAIHKLIQKFSSFGYRRVKPPMLEFEDSLLAPGPGERLAPETFRIMDPVSHKMLGARSDITPQISRIVATRLKNEPRPLRLTYANDVLRTRGSQLRTERQFTQVGCELIGEADSIHTDIEICVIAVISLIEIGITDITLDLTLPAFVKNIMRSLKEEDCNRIEKFVEQRDYDGLIAFGHEDVNIIASALKASGDAKKAFDTLSNIKCSDEIKARLHRLQSVCEGVYSALEQLGIKGVSLTVDLLEQRGFEYHKDIGFTLFSSSIHGELGRGGCYDIRFGQNENAETAKGFTLYMDTISKGNIIQEQKNSVYVGCNVAWSEIAGLQNDGWVVIRATKDDDSAPSLCSHVYENGDIKKL